MEVGVLFWFTLFAAVAIYWALPRGRDWFLIVSSSVYLVWLSPWSIGLLLGWCATFYLLAPKTQQRTKLARYIVAGFVVALLGYLAFFKYVPAVLSFAREQLGISVIVLEIAFPLGISYYTFKLIHYAVEVSRGNIKQHSPRDFFLYMLLFTIFPAGPIERFDHFLANRQKTWNSQLMAEGLTRIIHGLIKKFCLAENFVLPWLTWHGATTQEILFDLETFSPGVVWVHAVLWFLYFYLDFSAYSDIAIGGSRLFGFTIQENFNHPLSAVDIGDFWQRWHMSLAQWCRAYVYMPLIGLTRNPYVAAYATMITFALWHKASMNWLCWGLYHATGLALFRTWLRIKQRWKISVPDNLLLKTCSRMGTFLFVAASYTFLITVPFGAHSGIQLFARLFGM